MHEAFASILAMLDIALDCDFVAFSKLLFHSISEIFDRVVLSHCLQEFLEHRCSRVFDFLLLQQILLLLFSRDWVVTQNHFQEGSLGLGVCDRLRVFSESAAGTAFLPFVLRFCTSFQDHSLSPTLSPGFLPGVSFPFPRTVFPGGDRNHALLTQTKMLSFSGSHCDELGSLRESFLQSSVSNTAAFHHRGRECWLSQQRLQKKSLISFSTSSDAV